ncbi:MAG: SDR family oxidoreductase [Deltaproteobacteria bacterium]|nr:SDR family oxidoreductase [Deltaproteobacteria bacterium]
MQGMKVDLAGKVAVVTGGTRGLGKALALALGRSGAKVAVFGRKQENVDAALEEFQAAGIESMGMTAKVGDTQQISEVFAAVRERLQGIDILVNNVGMNIFTPMVSEADEKLWTKTIETNLTGVFLCTKEAVKSMKERGGGKIVNVSSIAGQRATFGLGIYCVAKAGVDMLTKVLAKELAASNIQVNAVAPSVIRTDFSKPMWSNENTLKQILQTRPRPQAERKRA